MIVKILPNDRGEPPTKLADAELLFEEGPLIGLRLVGFSIWQSKRGKSRNVTVPSRTYYVLGEKRGYALLRPANEDGDVDVVKRLILESFAEFERRMAVPT
jgi:hypothetical protein